MRINEILLESQSLEEGPFSQAVGKAVGGVAKGAGAVAGGIAGIPKAFKKGFDSGKKTVGGTNTKPATTKTKKAPTKLTASDGQSYTWKGAQWISDQTGKIATRAIAQELAKKAKSATAQKSKPTPSQEPNLNLPNPTLSGIAKSLSGQSSTAGSRAVLGDTTEAKRAIKMIVAGKPLEPYQIQALKDLLKKL